jgi:hypothetical protein
MVGVCPPHPTSRGSVDSPAGTTSSSFVVQLSCRQTRSSCRSSPGALRARRRGWLARRRGPQTRADCGVRRPSRSRVARCLRCGRCQTALVTRTGLVVGSRMHGILSFVATLWIAASMRTSTLYPFFRATACAQRWRGPLLRGRYSLRTRDAMPLRLSWFPCPRQSAARRPL